MALALLKHHEMMPHVEDAFGTIDVSLKTRAKYQKRVRKFTDFCANGLFMDSFQRYKDFLRTQDISVSYKNEHLTAAKQFVLYLERIGLIGNITAGIKNFRVEMKAKLPAITDNEMLRIREYVKHYPDHLPTIRVWAIICLMAFDGLRSDEVHSLDSSDIYGRFSRIRLVGKQRDDYEVLPASDITRAALKAYFKAWEPDPEGPLFFWASPDKGNPRLTADGIRRTITRLVRKPLGIDKGSHSFRRFHANQLIEEFGGNTYEVQQRLRHKDPRTTMRYVTMFDRQRNQGRVNQRFSKFADSPN